MKNPYYNRKAGDLRGNMLGGEMFGLLKPVKTFQFTVVTTSSPQTFALPLEASGTYNFRVTWGDGNIDVITVHNDLAATHNYASAGTHTVSIIGVIKGWRFGNAGDKTLIHNISSWGPLNLGNSNGYFYGCSNLTITASDNLDMVGTITLEDVFRDCSSLTTAPFMDIWNTASVTNMRYMFLGCSAFNQSVANFNTASVTSMRSMFYGCSAFNQSVANFNTSSVTGMSYMFRDCSAFNQSVANFNTASVTNMRSMFYGCSAFNQSVANFNTTSVTTMRYMFCSCSAFNQSVTNFNTASVTNMHAMFYGCSAFNQSVANFNTSSVTTMRCMFYGCSAFNQSVANFNTAAVTNMSYMFCSCSAFNQSVTNFNTASITSMSYMFYDCTAFNQSVANFNTASVTDMSYMFSNCSVFNQDLSGVNWIITALTNATAMLQGANAFSTANYDSLLVAWEAQAENVGVVFHAGDAQYSAGAPATARSVLVGAPSNWVITDGGQVP